MIAIPLQEFTLEIPTVNKLTIQPISSPRKAAEFGGIKVQDVYYQLLRADGRIVEHGNKSIPKDIYDLVEQWLDGDVSNETLQIVNDFFVAADWAVIVAIHPPAEENTVVEE